MSVIRLTKISKSLLTRIPSKVRKRSNLNVGDSILWISKDDSSITIRKA